jgi:thiamine biosynthesis lipoprotein ApbE
MKRIILLTACAALCGCAHFSTTQTEVRNEQTTTIKTRVAASTLFSSKSELAKFKALQNNASQSAEVGSLNQHGGTNTVAVLKALAEIVGALPK